MLATERTLHVMIKTEYSPPPNQAVQISEGKKRSEVGLLDLISGGLPQTQFLDSQVDERFKSNMFVCLHYSGQS